MSSKPLSIKAKPFEVSARFHKIREERVFTEEMHNRLELALRVPLAPIYGHSSILRREDTIGMEEWNELKELAESVACSVIDD